MWDVINIISSGKLEKEKKNRGPFCTSVHIAHKQYIGVCEFIQQRKCLNNIISLVRFCIHSVSYKDNLSPTYSFSFSLSWHFSSISELDFPHNLYKDSKCTKAMKNEN